MNPKPRSVPTSGPSHRSSVESIRELDIPQLVILKKRKVEVDEKVKDSKRNWKAQASFDVKFWTQAVEVEDLEIKSSELRRRTSIHQSLNSEVEWSQTTEAQQIMEQIKASEQCKKIYQRRINDLGMSDADSKSSRLSKESVQLG